MALASEPWSFQYKNHYHGLHISIANVNKPHRFSISYMYMSLYLTCTCLYRPLRAPRMPLVVVPPPAKLGKRSHSIKVSVFHLLAISLSLSLSLYLSLTHSLTHSLSLSLTHTHTLTHSLTHSLTQSLLFRFNSA